MGIQMEIIRQGAVEVITIAEAMSGDFVDALTEQLAAIGKSGVPRVAINLHEVPLFDSKALETLLDAKEEYERRGGALKLVAPTDLCREILDVTGLMDEFEILADTKSAVGSFAK